jgi:hypothetical protein
MQHNSSKPKFDSIEQLKKLFRHGYVVNRISYPLSERNKIKQQISQNQIGEGELRRFGWLERRIQDDIKCLYWLEDWLHYDKSLLVLTE